MNYNRPYDATRLRRERRRRERSLHRGLDRPVVLYFAFVMAYSFFGQVFRPAAL